MTHYFHSREPILPQMWHNSVTGVAISCHRRGTTIMSRIITTGQRERKTAAKVLKTDAWSTENSDFWNNRKICAASSRWYIIFINIFEVFSSPSSPNTLIMCRIALLSAHSADILKPFSYFLLQNEQNTAFFYYFCTPELLTFLL